MSESILRALYKLKIKHSNNPTEDFVTEIFAYILKNDEVLLKDFIKKFKIGQIEDLNESTIKTQVTYSKLKNHKHDSIPDVSIYGNNLIVFIECKINAYEGDDQLARYADHLDNFNSKGVLVYLTRDFDPKSKEVVLRNCKKDTNFLQIRWYEIFNFLKKKKKKNLFITEFLKFMKEMNLANNNQYTPTDLIALNNFSRVRKMMDDTMYGEVSNKFIKLIGKISTHAKGMTQLRNHDRYIFDSHHAGGFQFLLGYWLNSFNDHEYPEVKLVIEVGPNWDNRKVVVPKLKKIISQEEYSEWGSYALGSPSSWAGIYVSRSLKSFLHSEDHIESIKKFFLSELDRFNQAKIELEK